MQSSTYLIIFQIWFLYFWNVIIRCFESCKFLSTLLFFNFFCINYQFWPESNKIKLLTVSAFFILGFLAFIKTLTTIKKIKWPSIFKTKLMLEKKLKFTNNEIVNIFDVLAKNKNSEALITKNIWESKRKRSIRTIEEKRIIQLKNFFLTDFKVSYFTKLSVLTSGMLVFFLTDNSFYQNLDKSFSTRGVDVSKAEYSSNIWIFPPKSSKQSPLFLEKNFYDKNFIKNNFIIQNKSRILINIFNTKPKAARLVFKGNDNKSIEKDLTVVDYNKLKYENFVQEGTYTIYIDNSVFQKLLIKEDKAPIVKFIDEPNYKNGFLSFKFEIYDENNKHSWLEIGDKNSLSKQIVSKKFKDFDRTFSKPYHLIPLDNVSNKKTKKFNKNIEQIILVDKKYDLIIKSIDTNKNQSFSEIKKLRLIPKKFMDKEANKIIALRKDLFIKENTSEILIKLRNLAKKNNNNFVKQNIYNLIKFTQLSELDKKSEIEVLMNKMWEISIFLENNNIDIIKNKIITLKQKLAGLLEESSNEKEIRETVTELEVLLEKFLELTKVNSKEKEKLLSQLEKDLKNNNGNISKKTDNLRDRANNLVKKIDSFLNTQNSDSDNKILKKIQSTYELQKKIIDQTFKKDESINKKLLLKQRNVENKIINFKNDLLEFLPDSEGIIDKIIKNSRQSEDNISNKNFDIAIQNQRNILSEIKQIYKNLIKNNFSEEKEDEGSSNKNIGESEDDQYDIPIVFEKNSLNKIIKKIREMTNEVQRKEKEKKYLKSLLPDF